MRAAGWGIGSLMALGLGGIGIGIAINVCLSITMGAGLIVLLRLSHMYYPLGVWATFITEAIPGLDNLPGWTFLVLSCVIRKFSEDKLSRTGTKFARSFARGPLGAISAATFGIQKATLGLAQRGGVTMPQRQQFNQSPNSEDAEPAQRESLLKSRTAMNDIRNRVPARGITSLKHETI